MKTGYLILLALSGFLLCCKNQQDYRKQFEVVSKLLSHFENNDTIAVRSMIGVPLEEIGTNKELINFDVEKAYRLLKKYGVPGQNKFFIKEYPLDDPRLVDVFVPIIKNGKDKLKNAEIKISFVKYLPIDKIIKFYVITDNGTIPIDSSSINLRQ